MKDGPIGGVTRLSRNALSTSAVSATARAASAVVRDRFPAAVRDTPRGTSGEEGRAEVQA